MEDCLPCLVKMFSCMQLDRHPHFNYLASTCMMYIIVDMHSRLLGLWRCVCCQWTTLPTKPLVV